MTRADAVTVDSPGAPGAGEEEQEAGGYRARLLPGFLLLGLTDSPSASEGG